MDLFEFRDKTGLSCRTFNALYYSNIRTTERIVELRQQEVKLMRGFGEKCLWDLRHCLAIIGLHLKDDKMYKQVKVESIGGRFL
jgi:DNA-directed RNA polymerase alpha subunit